MSSNGTDNVAENHADLGTPNGESVAHHEYHTKPNRARRWALLAGLLAGLASFGIGEALYDLIPAKKVKTSSFFGFNSVDATPETMSVADVRNSALAFGVLGACLGGFCGIAGGVGRRSAWATSATGLLGLTLGFATGAGVSLLVLPFFLSGRPTEPEHELIVSMIMLTSVWGLTAAPAGLAFATGLGEWRLGGRALAAAVVGAVLGTVVFALIGSVIFPLAETVKPISTTWPSRLVARLLVAGATGGALWFLPLTLGANGQQREFSVPAKS